MTLLDTSPQRHRAAILSIGTAVPYYQVRQTTVERWMIESLSLGQQPEQAHLLQRLYRHSGIETRYTCLPDVFLPPQESRFAPGQDLTNVATTAERMAVYEQVSVEIGTAAARQALEYYEGPDAPPPAEVAATITHLLVVSCTGFFAPGLDQMIARQLDLGPHVERTFIGFMGCAAAFNALRLASQIVQGQPRARVLVVCVELSSLHLQPGDKPVDLVSGALFADGAGACMVGLPDRDQHDIFTIQRIYTELTPEAEASMVWRIGDYGYMLHLSREIPAQLARVAPVALRRLFNQHPPDLAFWAIHPGGRAILDRLEAIFQLIPEHLDPSREVLRHYGNMSSPTILFVLQEHRRRLRQYPPENPLHGVAMAFGPGLVTELAHLVYQGGPVSLPVAEPVRSTVCGVSLT
jgi:predicted naringenin-chalcone synthase